MSRLLWVTTALVCRLAAAIQVEVEDEPVFKVVRCTPTTDDQLRLLNSLHKESHKHSLDFWKSPTSVGYTVDIMAPSPQMAKLEHVFAEAQIPFNLTISDVQRLILEREVLSAKRAKAPEIGSFAKRLKDDSGRIPNRARYQLGEYHGYGEIVRWLNEIAQEYPQYARVLSIGTTAEGRNIIAIRLGTANNRTEKRVVVIDGGIHAREWGAIHTALYFIEQLIVGYENNDPEARAWLDSLNFYIIPVLNPDGFEYTRSDVTPTKRLWRKNRAGISCFKDQWFRDKCCGGVDLNRNFDFFWGGEGSSDDRCSEIYQGTSAFSEMEAQALRNLFLSPELQGKIDAYITLHTYSQMWIHPFSHARRSVPADIAELQAVGRRAVRALEEVFGTKYRFGTGADILYPSSGGSDDWAKAKGGAKYVYLIELRPGDEVWDGFVLDSRQLIPMGKETWEGVKVVVRAVMARQQDALRRSQILQAQQSVRRTGRPLVSTVGRRRLLRPVARLRHRRPFHVRPRPRMVGDEERKKPVQTVKTIKRMGKTSSAKALLTKTPTSRIVHTGSTSTARPQAARFGGACRDESPWCNAWLRGNPNVCQVSSIYMSRDCRATCRFC